MGDEMQEAEYRRGYADGFIRDVETIPGLPRKTYDAAFTFWQTNLTEWAQGDARLKTPAPRFEGGE